MGNSISHQPAVPIILIPLIWLAVTTLVVAACQVASCGDGSRPGPTVRQELLDEPTALRLVPDGES
jgi:hypothetical protein